ncbi:hypothetical protein [Falsiphaeobacter marinintestinus]|uniref:hypothetical protein n=1 Tax=Falsiphaeobacter marinintestinus TaxID=1492905 RepID=UPI0011B7C6EC|nr:hypothetical protein [Phaeobacter marinintestinus]
MSVSFRILADRGLVYVRYDGMARVADTFAAFSEYVAHPDCKPGQKQLVDLSRLTGFERDYFKIMSLQAKKAELFAAQGVETLMVYLVTGAEPDELARTVMRSWDAYDGVVPLIQTSEADALQLLGQPEQTIQALLERVN